MKTFRVFVYFLVALLALAGGVMMGQRKAALPAPAGVDLDAPKKLEALALLDLEGRTQHLSQWNGKIRVVNFWATWCTPCREEMPMLAQLARELEGKVQFIGIGIDEAHDMREFIKKTPVSYPLLVGGAEVIPLTSELGNKSTALPFTVVIDASGRLRAYRGGKVTEEQVREMVGL